MGLAGSSAIITATLQCLMGFYGLGPEDIPKPLQPSFVLSVEMDELFIQAGLQDRVVPPIRRPSKAGRRLPLLTRPASVSLLRQIQTYEGCMFMDFDRELVEGRGYGTYERLPTANLPFLWHVARG